MSSQDKLFDALETQEAIDAQQEIMVEQAISQADSRALARELHSRGFSIKDIFGIYYELEEAHGSKVQLDVEDATLAGY